MNNKIHKISSAIPLLDRTKKQHENADDVNSVDSLVAWYLSQEFLDLSPNKQVAEIYLNLWKSINSDKNHVERQMYQDFAKELFVLALLDFSSFFTFYVMSNHDTNS